MGFLVGLFVWCGLMIWWCFDVGKLYVCLIVLYGLLVLLCWLGFGVYLFV